MRNWTKKHIEKEDGGGEKSYSPHPAPDSELMEFRHFVGTVA